MRRSIFALAFTVAAATLISAAALAQGAPPVWPAPPQQSPPATVWPDPPTQSQPQAVPQRPAPAANPARRPAIAAPTPAPTREPKAAKPPAAARAAPARATPARTAPARAINCTGPFARTSNQAQLEAAFGAKNVQFTQVDGPGGAKLNASVVFPDDPKRRLEVLWHDEPNHARPSAIVITGASQWLAPRGVKLGMTMPDIEKRNGKPFKLNGFGGESGGNVTDWDGGKLDQLGACRMGVRFREDSKAAPEAVSKATGAKPFTSKDADMLAAKPRAAEIVIGYGE